MRHFIETIHQKTAAEATVRFVLDRLSTERQRKTYKRNLFQKESMFFCKFALSSGNIY